ncbi:MAG: TerB N-terminal domain-containing protein [Verrucomicrobiaceae bacterium]|nr:TerB N-terminal domain-containing protein [Verrucomicrobiaceae bacterium]
MGWSFRKSFGSGPFRFTLSKSGISGSVGFKGLRVGANSRGSWISMGAGGIRYRHFAPHPKPPPQAPRSEAWKGDEFTPPPGSHGPFEAMQQAGVIELTDSSSQALLAELNERRKKVMSGCALGCLGTLLMTVGFAIFPFNLILMVALAAGWWQTKKNATITLCYDLDPTAQAGWDALRASLLSLKQASRLWHVQAKANVRDSRYHAGASELWDRGGASVSEQVPELVVTNVSPVCVQCGELALYFFPDRVFVYRSKDIGGISYASLKANASLTTFTDGDGAPTDAKVVGHTWQYVNRNGSPDRRFANNRQVPICEYELLELSSETGLRQSLKISRLGLAPSVVNALTIAARQMPREVGTAEVERRPSSPPPMPGARDVAAPPPLPQAVTRSVEQEPPPVWAERAKLSSALIPSSPARVEEPPPPPLPPRTPPAPPVLQWIEPGQPVEFAGIEIADGMIYWQDTDRDLGEPSALSTMLEVADKAAPSDAELGYWPDYLNLTPAQRRAYLEWLAAGRRDADPSMRAPGYVTLFFHGLERRLILDQNASPALVEELIGLITHYASAHASYTLLRGYGLQLLHFAGWRQGLQSYGDLWPRLLALDDGHTDEQAIKLITAQLFESGQPLDWRVAWRIARNDEMSRNSTVIERTGEKFVELFRHRYAETFGAGINLLSAKNPARIEYRPSSPGLQSMRYLPLQRQPFEFKVTNVMGIARQFKKLPDIWNTCVEDLSGYSRSLVAKKPNALAAWQLLPAELRASQPHPLREPLDQMLATAPEERGIKVLPVSAIAGLLDMTERAKLTMVQSKQLATSMNELGFNIAPNPQFSLQAFAWDQAVALYPRVPGDEVPEPQIAGLVRFLYLAIAVAAADGSLDERELDAFNRTIAPEITRATDWRHLKATEAALSRDANAATRALASIAENISPRARRPVLRSLLHLSAADGEVSLDEQRMLRRIARALEIEEDWIDTWMRDDLELREVTVTTARAPAASGEAIPARKPQATSTFTLDMTRVQQLTQETHEVVTLLSEVMADPAEDAPAPSAPAAPVSSTSTPAWMDTLDARYRPPLAVLIAHDEVTIERFDRLAKEHHLLPDDLLHSINAWADESLGDFLLEKDDTVRVFRDLLPAS